MSISEKLRALADVLEHVPEPRADAGHEPMVSVQYVLAGGVDGFARALHTAVTSDGVTTAANVRVAGVLVSAGCYAPYTPPERSVVADYTEATF